MVQLLLDAGADVNARTASDATAMHIAACSNSGDVVRALVKAGGNGRDNRAYKGKLIGTLLEASRYTGTWESLADSLLVAGEFAGSWQPCDCLNNQSCTLVFLCSAGSVTCGA